MMKKMENSSGLGRFIVGGIMVVIFISGIGRCSENESKRHVQNNRVNGTYEWNYNLGVEEQKMPTRFIKPMRRNDNCMTKKEFYEGMEDAEMKGMADDPSAQDIYDEFNR